MKDLVHPKQKGRPLSKCLYERLSTVTEELE